MTLIEHLEELRNRIFIALIAWVIAASIAFIFRLDILSWLKQPLPHDMTLYQFNILEPFLVSMQIAGFFGFVLASPIIGWQTWAFIAPGLYDEERRWSVPFIIGTAISFTFGVIFARYVVLPFALPILLGFLSGETNLLLSTNDYISKLLLYMAVFGIVFEMPVLSFLLARLGLVYAQPLRKYRRHALVVGCIIAAAITPTADPINFFLVAGPLVILYEISILVVRYAQRRVPVSDITLK
ncbi:MAG: twin-arginine translocase subunit TatC [Deinococcales bacterium]